MHHDFRLVERDAPSANDSVGAVGDVLRSAWRLPTDTFVTSDLPLLLTLIARRSWSGRHGTAG
jgi:hypothetical protein